MAGSTPGWAAVLKLREHVRDDLCDTVDALPWIDIVRPKVGRQDRSVLG